MIRVLLVDDHDLVRTGLKMVLQDTPRIEIVGEASNGEAAIAFVRSNSPDVVLMDVNMPGMGGLEATRQIGCLGTSKIVVVSMHSDGVFPKKLLEAGASGYLTKGASADEVITAIEVVYAGQQYISREVAQNMALSAMDGKSNGIDKLSKRELQVMRMVAQGKSNIEISEVLHLSPKTVSTYRSRIYAKVGVHSDVELTHLAIKQGIVDPASDI